MANCFFFLLHNILLDISENLQKINTNKHICFDELYMNMIHENIKKKESPHPKCLFFYVKNYQEKTAFDIRFWNPSPRRGMEMAIASIFFFFLFYMVYEYQGVLLYKKKIFYVKNYQEKTDFERFRHSVLKSTPMEGNGNGDSL